MQEINNGKPIDVVCISEHNMKVGDEEFLCIPNYVLAANFSRCDRNGGSCILVNRLHDFKSLNHIAPLSIPRVFECCAIELSSQQTIIISVYRIPNASKSSIKVFFNKLASILDKFCYSKKKLSYAETLT